ncbi:MAG: hypothetical protein AAF597_14165, partial [Bacteroidota bacterium]
MKKGRLKLLSTLSFFFVLLLPVSAQFIIEAPDGTPATIPVADDINVCFDQGATLDFRIIATGDVTDPTLNISLATGRFVDGDLSVINSSGAYTLGPNTGTPEAPAYQITGTFTAGDFVQFSLDLGSDCSAIGVNGVTHTVTVNGTSEASNTHDALFLTLSIGNLSPESIGVGQSGTATGTITGGGNGCVNEVVFRLIDAPGATTTELRVE